MKRPPGPRCNHWCLYSREDFDCPSVLKEWNSFLSFVNKSLYFNTFHDPQKVNGEVGEVGRSGVDTGTSGSMYLWETEGRPKLGVAGGSSLLSPFPTLTPSVERSS